MKMRNNITIYKFYDLNDEEIEIIRNLIPKFIHNKYKEKLFNGEFDAITMFVDIVDSTNYSYVYCKL